jgi:hypothetical protein
MDERSLLFVGIIIVIVTGALVWSSNRATARTATDQESRQSSLPPVPYSTPLTRPEKRRTASPIQDFDAAPRSRVESQLPQPRHSLYPTNMHPVSYATVSLEEQRLYSDLLTKVREPGIAERLIAYERRQTPKGTRLEWLRDANTRWVDDNR